MCIYIKGKCQLKFFFSRTVHERINRHVLRRDWKTNPRVSMNEKRLSDDDDFQPSLGVAKLTSPRCSPSDERVGDERGGEHSLPPFPRHISIPLFVPSPPPPSRRHPRCLTPPLETCPSTRVEHVLLYSQFLSEVVRYRPRRVHQGLRFIRHVPRCA